MTGDDVQWLARRSGRRRPPLFETVELDVLGWLTLLVPCVVLGVIVGVMTGGALVGILGWVAGSVIVGLAVAIAADRWRHSRSFVRYGVDDPDGAARLLAENGIDAVPGSYGPPEDETRYVTIQQRDLRRALELIGPRGR